MSITVNSAQYSNFNFKKSGELYTLQTDMTVTLKVTRNGSARSVKFKFKRGFISDGLSAPSKFQVFLPRWESSNSDYNLAAVIHDALYFNAGFGVYSRSEADDFFRGILRISGVSRLLCSIADLALASFGGSHWGEDTFGTKSLVSVSQ